jgi:hypothetical protein
MPVPPIAQQLLGRGTAFGVKIAREAMARVIGQDAHKHDRIVLDVVRGAARAGEVFADAMRGFFGGRGA